MRPQADTFYTIGSSSVASLEHSDRSQEQADERQRNDGIRKTRIVELDFFRGAALLVIFWDHLHWFVGTAAPLHYGFSDAAPVFIFLSGYVAGLVYWKTLVTKGLRAVVSKALRRSFQIYCAHLGALAVLLGIAAVTPQTAPRNPIHDLVSMMTDHPWNTIVRLTSLQYVPTLFDILPLYVILMATVPAILVIARRNWRIVVGVAFAFYLGVQLIPALNFASYFPSWSLNPLAWFFPFAIAMVMASKSKDGSLRIPVRPFALAIAGGVLLYAFLDLATVQNVLAGLRIVPPGMRKWFPSPFPLIEKTNLQPFSLIHFFCLAYLASAVKDPLRSALKHRLARPLILCGQHSLPLFSAGIVLTYVFADFIAVLGKHDALFFVFVAVGWIATLGLGYTLSVRTERAKTFVHKPLENNKARVEWSMLGL